MDWIKLVWLIMPYISGIQSTNKEERTLAFVFDVTFSMVADLEHLKYGIQEIFLDVTSNVEKKYSHYLFLGFHDPAIGLPFLTDNKTELLEYIKGFYAFPLAGNNDCEEQCLPAIYHSLYSIHENSDILVFTDDNSKGNETMPLIMDLIKLLKPKINFIITPGCNYGNIDENYEKIVEATGGQIYEIVKRNVSSLMHNIGDHQLKHDWTLMVNTQFSVGGTHDVPLQIDSSNRERVLISVTGANVQLNLLDPGKKEFMGNMTIDMQNVKEIQLEAPSSGQWTMQITGAGRQRLRVMGQERKRALGRSMLGIFIAYCVSFGLIIAFCLWQYKWFWQQCKDLKAKWCC